MTRILLRTLNKFPIGVTVLYITAVIITNQWDASTHKEVSIVHVSQCQHLNDVSRAESEPEGLLSWLVKQMWTKDVNADLEISLSWHKIFSWSNAYFSEISISEDASSSTKPSGKPPE